MMKQRFATQSCRRLLCALGLSALTGIGFESAQAATALISRNSAGIDSGNSQSFTPIFSPDGKKIAFMSYATNITAQIDTNQYIDVFVRDLASGVTTLVSQNRNGTATGQYGSHQPVFSPDSKKIAFLSSANDLTALTYSTSSGDIFVRDLAKGVTTLVSQNSTGTKGGNGLSDTPVFSPDSKKIAFRSYATNLSTQKDSSINGDVFVRDLAKGVTTLVSRNSAGTDSGNKRSEAPVFSPNSKKIAFQSYASNLTTLPDSNGAQDVFVRDLTSGVTTLISRNSAGTASGNGAASAPSFSPDGSKMVFLGYASDLTTSSDSNNTQDVFVRDLTSGVTTLVSRNSAGTNSGDSLSSDASFSPNSKKIAFVSTASDLTPLSDSNNTTDIFVRDLAGGVTALISRNSGGTASGNGESFGTKDSIKPLFSPDGSKIAFQSFATNLTNLIDINGAEDIFVRDLMKGVTTLVSQNIAGTNSGDARSYNPIFSPDSKKIAFRSFASNLTLLSDSNAVQDVFVRDLAGGATNLVSRNSAGTASGNRESFVPVFSPDSRKIAFQGYASDLANIADTNGTQDAFLGSIGASFIVTETSDASADGVCDAAGVNDGCNLREAISAANTYNASNNNAGATVTFDATAFATKQTIKLGGSELAISSNVTIIGPATANAGVTVDADQKNHVFVISSGVVFISNLNLTNGKVPGNGGGISNSGVLTLNNCALFGNISASGGGGIFNDNTMTLNNCTLFDNKANFGGGIYNNGTLTVNNCTIVANLAGRFSRGGGISNSAAGLLNLNNTIVSGNSAAIGSDIDGTVASGDYNLVQRPSGATLSGSHNITNTAARLDMFADNGGPTKTLSLRWDSPALDAGNATGTDQRGRKRPFDVLSVINVANGSDIGSVEQGSSNDVQIGPNFVVNNINDHDDGTCGTTDCTLREAINAANAHANAATPDAITFDFTVLSAQTITLFRALPELTDDVAITGPAAGVTVKESSTNHDFTMFTVNSGVTATFGDLNLSYGYPSIYNLGTATVTNCTLNGNFGITYNSFGISNSGTLTTTNCTLNGNNSGIANGGTATVTNCTLNDSRRDGDGAGIRNNDGTLTATNCNFSNNDISLYVSGGVATAINCTLTSSTYGARINDYSANNKLGSSLIATNCTMSNSLAGIYNQTGGTLTTTGCTLSGNTYGIENRGAMTTANCTVSGNNFYGIYSDTLSKVAITNCTLSGNNTGLYQIGGPATLKNTLVAGNLKANKRGRIIDGGHNILTGTAEEVLLEVDGSGKPLLKDNGGPTQTIALLSGSPALDAGNSTISTDQRGFKRPVDLASVANAAGGDGSDIGAFELDQAQSGVNFVVNTVADHDDGLCGVGDCTLREAINASNANADKNAITFVAGLNGTIALASELPSLSSNLSINGPGAKVLTVRRDTGGQYRIFTVSNDTLNGPTVTISGLTISNGALTDIFGYGGGLLNSRANLTLESCTVNGNSAFLGGGLFVESGGSSAKTTINNCTFSGNTATFNGGAIFNLGGGGEAGTSILTLTNSTLSSNIAGDKGGAILNYGDSTGTGSATLNNCTLSGNTGIGQGIYNLNGGDSTVTTTLSHTILNNGSMNLVNENASIVSNGYNMSNDDSSAFLNLPTDKNSTDAKLAALADNGGPTQTHALLPGSPARNAGNPAFDATTTPFDQRGTGFARVRGGRIDIGAFESSGQAPTAILLSNSSVAENSGANAPIGILHTADDDPGDSFTYSLPAGRGSNSLFNIAGNVLQAKGDFDYEKQNIYAILVRVSDGDGLNFEKTFVISVTDTNDAPVLDNSGEVQLTVSATGTSITDLLKTGAYNAPITDEDAGAVQGIAVFDALEADSPQGRWEFSTDGGTTWTALGTVSGKRARLLASDGSKTRLRFLAKSGAPATLPDALRFFAWDQSHTSNGDVNGAFGYATQANRGGKTAFSLAAETVTVLAPGQAAPQLNIASPTAGTLPTAPTEATGSATSVSGIVSVRFLALYRTKEGANMPGYWNGDVSNPQFLEANMVSSLPAVQSNDGFATWTVSLPQSATQPALPLLVPGQYRLRMEALDAYGQTAVQSVSFVINDGTPQVAITSPQAGGSYTSGTGTGSLSEVTGTADDSDGIAKVTVYLYREATSSNSAGYWNGDVNNPTFTPDYDASINEVAAVSTPTTGPAYSTWRLQLPQLAVGDYSLRATARDSKGNFSGASAGVITNVMTTNTLSKLSAIASAPTLDNVLKFTITASKDTPFKGLDAVAVASSGSIQLNFSRATPEGAFAVRVNGANVKVQSTVRVGNTVTLLLVEGALLAGDKVGVSWKDGLTTVTAE